MAGLHKEIIPIIIDNLEQENLLKISAKAQKYANYKSINLIQDGKKFLLSIDGTLNIIFQELAFFKTKITYSETFEETDSIETRIESIFEVVVKKLVEFLKRIGKRLENLTINVQHKMRSRIIRQIQLRNLKNLSKFEISCTSEQIDILKYNFIDFESLKNVRKSLEIPYTNISFDQLKQLKAENITITWMNDNLNMENLAEYMDLWRNGGFHDKLESLEIQKPKSSRKFPMESDFKVINDASNFKSVESKIDKNKFIGICEDSQSICIDVWDNSETSDMESENYAETVN
ncbi:unnamed protein product [Caenorhabditis angaria]|uniref:F-box associated domain-containing protein n=1 Tax=Caenorhabditis angaria TaxID=860376 RepID=A0A9P1IJH1_9PELO|nr:unnamed protein product [Caenorhabditis angaria]